MKLTDCSKIMAKDAYASYKVRKVMGGWGYLYPLPEYPYPYFIPKRLYWGVQGAAVVGLFVSGVPAGTSFRLNSTTNDCEGEGGSHGNVFETFPLNTAMTLSVRMEHNYVLCTATTDFTGWICYGDAYDFELTSVGALSPYIKGLWARGSHGGCGGAVSISCWSDLTGVEFLCGGSAGSGADDMLSYTLGALTGIKYFIPLYSACYNRTYDLRTQTSMTTQTFYYTARDAHNVSLRVPNGVDTWTYSELLRENNITIIS